MITRRDLMVAALTVTATLAGVATLRSQQPVMGSRVFDWNALTVQTTQVGSTRKVVQLPTATLDELEMHYTSLHPQTLSHAAHRHPDEELIIVKEGTVESMVNGQTVRAGPGSIVFQAANQLHSIRNAGDTEATYLVIRWNSPGMLAKRGQ
jgi:quercetin dioxygenase-like cupin family protein